MGVTHDFVPRFVGDALVGPNGAVYKEVAGKAPVINLSFYRPTNKDGRPFMPVEFAVAAYRFGHSMIRPFYVINQSTLDRGGVPVFGAEGGFNLNGGRPVPPDLVVEWKNILPVDPYFPARKPRKIDTQLSLPLTALPGSVVPPPDPRSTSPYATRSAASTSDSRPASRSPARWVPRCSPTPLSGWATIRLGRRGPSGTTS